jgi:hypothetical protein
VAAMASTFASPSGVSIIAKTRVAAFASPGTGPTRRLERIGPYDRPPSGGYFALATAAAASSAVSTSGTMTPTAPASSALPIAVTSFASTRTSPTEVWPASIASRPVIMPEYPNSPCCASRAT